MYTHKHSLSSNLVVSIDGPLPPEGGGLCRKDAGISLGGLLQLLPPLSLPELR